MVLKVECAWARVYFRESKELCSIQMNPGEGSLKFPARRSDKRYRI